MIPAPIEKYLADHHLSFAHHVHPRAIPAQELAATEHVSGCRVAKPVVVSLDGWLAIAVVPAHRRVDLEALARATASVEVDLAPEPVFEQRFWPCEKGAEPPLAMFGIPIYMDEALSREPFLVMRAGTHEDSILVATRDWMRSEGVQPLMGLAALFGAVGLVPIAPYLGLLARAGAMRQWMELLARPFAERAPMNLVRHLVRRSPRTPRWGRLPSRRLCWPWASPAPEWASPWWRGRPQRAR
jgi:Ala-tRNA(Pro) deacylase